MKNLENFVFQQFSKCGIIAVLTKNDGPLLWASDECGELLTKCFGGTGEWEEFCGMLNNFYLGYGYSKNTAGKGALEIDSMYFSMVGLNQPQPFCDVLEKLGATKDGLADRFITVSAPAYLEGTPDSIVWPDAILNRPKDWLLIALSYIYDEHSVNGAIQYKFSEEALEELKAF
uniref:Uncharacterized protein n=1 Tax=Romanomermis culicivorax TaxID=13658 RepID=A0A915JDT5_ROMCU